MSQEHMERTVSGYYGSRDLATNLEQMLRSAGLDPATITIEQLAPLDHFHAFGMAGTMELARLAGVSAGQRVVDVGGGIGGPARLLASRYDCQVTVLDLTPDFCEAGRLLTNRTHLDSRVSFVCGSALDMPFADGSFDLAWTQHAAMNIADKPRLYQQMHRVLRPSGRLALFDVMAGPNAPIHFPVPWATEESSSFLRTPSEVRALVQAAGFREVAWLDGRELVAKLQQLSGSASPIAPVTLNVGMIMGPDASTRVGNMTRNLQEGRATLGMGVFERQ